MCMLWEVCGRAVDVGSEECVSMSARILQDWSQRSATEIASFSGALHKSTGGTFAAQQRKVTLQLSFNSYHNKMFVYACNLYRLLICSGKLSTQALQVLQANHIGVMQVCGLSV